MRISCVLVQRRRTAATLLLLLSTTSLMASGRDARAQEHGADVTLDELTVTGDGAAAVGYQPRRSSFGTGTETPLLDTPANIAVVSQAVLRDQRVLSLDEALRNVSGIAQTNSLGGTQEGVVRRGFGTTRDSSILRDGRRTVLQQNFSHSLERVEVLKGPASLLYGISEPGGLINLVSKRPLFTRQNSLDVTATSFGGAIIQPDLTGPIEGTNLAYRIVGDVQDYDYWRNFGTIRRQVAAPSLTWRGDATTVTVGYEFAHYNIPFDRGTTFDPRTGRPLRVPRERRFDEAVSRVEAMSHLGSLDLEHRFDDDWKVNAGFSASNLTYDDNQIRPTSYNPATGLLTRRADASRGADFNAQVARVDLVGRFEALGLRHDLLLGAMHERVDYYRRESYRGANQGGFNVFNPVYGRLGASDRLSLPASNNRDRLINTSLYLQDSIHLTDGLILVAGASAQFYDQLAYAGVPAVASTDIDGIKPLPRAGLVYRIAPHLSVYGSYTQSFRPNVTDLDRTGPLLPEEGDAYEVGIKAELGAGLLVTGAVFDTEKTNVLVTQVVNGTRTATTAGKARSRGFELDVGGADRTRLVGDRELRVHRRHGHRGSDAGRKPAAQHAEDDRVALPHASGRARGPGHDPGLGAARRRLPRTGMGLALRRGAAGRRGQQLHAARLRRVRCLPELPHQRERPSGRASAQPQERPRRDLLPVLGRQQRAGGGGRTLPGAHDGPGLMVRLGLRDGSEGPGRPQR
ncbi:iron complex outermembrane receptor protein [Methylorubrum pseudosasae]|nr:iron complex outermembrane receptor protein [Methylorubrum pseudosasae]